MFVIVNDEIVSEIDKPAPTLTVTSLKLPSISIIELFAPPAATAKF